MDSQSRTSYAVFLTDGNASPWTLQRARKGLSQRESQGKNRRSSEIQGTELDKCLRAWIGIYRSMPAGVARCEPVWPSGKALGW